MWSEMFLKIMNIYLGIISLFLPHIHRHARQRLRDAGVLGEAAQWLEADCDLAPAAG